MTNEKIAEVVEEIPTAAQVNHPVMQLGYIRRLNTDSTEDEEEFEDGDENGSSEEEEEDFEEEDSISMDTDTPFERSESPLNSIASAASALSSTNRLPLPQVAATVLSELSRSNPTPAPAPLPLSSSTLHHINEYLQNLNHSAHHLMPHKVRLSGPIRANVNIRHGVWAPRLRCRKRKNLHAKDGIWIHPSCSLEQLVALVKAVLPDEFDWDPIASPLRYQAVNDQSLQSLKTVGGTVQPGNTLYSAFDLVRNRRSDGDNFILQLFVYGTWTILSKSPNMSHFEEDTSNNNFGYNSSNGSVQPPPPKKKYQQVHFNQMQRALNLPSINNTSYATVSDYQSSQNQNNNTTPPPTPHHQQIHPTMPMYNSHPLAANPPVTFLPTVTLEMKLNGVFVPVEISRRSFVSAYRACTISRPSPPPPATPLTDPSKLAEPSKPSISSMMSATPPPQDTDLNKNNIAEDQEDIKKENEMA